MRLKKAQKDALLEWIAAGKKTDEINDLAAEHTPPFNVSRQQVDGYRKRRKVDIEAIIQQDEMRSLTSGLAIKEVRVSRLKRLAEMMEGDLFGDRLWTDEVKGIGSGTIAEIVEYEEFNRSEVDAYRGLLDDIAKEIGHRSFRPAEPNEASTDVVASALPSIPADVIAPSFVNFYRDIRDHRHTEYLVFGGRGSTKSSFISLAIIYLIVNNPQLHALALRQTGNTLRDSVYSQLIWAIGELGLEDQFRYTTNPLEIIYLPTKQKVYFRGGDDPLKIKSIKPAFGYIGALWMEELDQFRGAAQVRSIEQSAIRGGDEAYIFKSWNPPRTINNWANKYAQIPKEAQYQHKSDYTQVPPEWLGKAFLDEAEHLKSVNPAAYEHEYLGVANSAGGMVFENVTIRKITDDEIAQFDRVLNGLDFGYYPDPAHYGKLHYDAARLTLYIFGEVRKWKASNRVMYDAIKKYGYADDELLIADSAEPKSVADYREYGATARAAEKGPESVRYSMKWLQSLTSIVIDNERAPYAADEFLSYEYERTKDDEIIDAYPDKDNHAIDAARYACNRIWKRRGQ